MILFWASDLVQDPRGYADRAGAERRQGGYPPRVGLSYRRVTSRPRARARGMESRAGRGTKKGTARLGARAIGRHVQVFDRVLDWH